MTLRCELGQFIGRASDKVKVSRVSEVELDLESTERQALSIGLRQQADVVFAEVLDALAQLIRESGPVQSSGASSTAAHNESAVSANITVGGHKQGMLVTVITNSTEHVTGVTNHGYFS
jgi:hypothetical protein